ncbi:MAG: hypothetical protein ACRDGD_03350 [Candidatus Limnocylindria bacterium]
MFAPNQTTYDLADRVHEERQHHASLIAKIQSDRADTSGVGRDAHRRVTVRRLSAAVVGTLLSIAIAAAAVAVQQPADAGQDQPPGGGLTLKR